MALGMMMNAPIRSCRCRSSCCCFVLVDGWHLVVKSAWKVFPVTTGAGDKTKEHYESRSAIDLFKTTIFFALYM